MQHQVNASVTVEEVVKDVSGSQEERNSTDVVPVQSKPSTTAGIEPSTHEPTPAPAKAEKAIPI